MLVALAALGMTIAGIPGCGPASSTSRPRLTGVAPRPAPSESASTTPSTPLNAKLREVGTVYWRHQSSCIAWKVEDGDLPDEVLLKRSWHDDEGQVTITHKVSTQGNQVYVYAPIRRVETGPFADGSRNATTSYSYCLDIFPLKAPAADRVQIGSRYWYFSLESCRRGNSVASKGCSSRIQ